MALYFLWSFLITLFLFMQARYLWKGNRFIKARNWAVCSVSDVLRCPVSLTIYDALLLSSILRKGVWGGIEETHRYWLAWCRPPGWRPERSWCSPGSEAGSEVAYCVSASASGEPPPGQQVWKKTWHYKTLKSWNIYSKFCWKTAQINKHNKSRKNVTCCRLTRSSKVREHFCEEYIL